MTDIISVLVSFVQGLLALPFPGLGISFGVVFAGLLLINFLFWLLSRLGGCAGPACEPCGFS